MRLNKFIAANSPFSRRKADELIKEGKVFVNDKKITELGTQIDSQKDKVKVLNKIIKAQTKFNYFALNKPSGYITTRNDEFKRKNIMDLLPKIENLKPIGRLDKDTEGLILISNDGDFINKITHPKFECEKEYFVKITGQLSAEEKIKLEKGINIEKRRTAPAKIIIDKTGKSQTHLKIVIHEGRNRQIRKMFASINHPVKYLQRIRIGHLTLDGLEKGKYRDLTQKEIDDY